MRGKSAVGIGKKYGLGNAEDGHRRREFAFPYRRKIVLGTYSKGAAGAAAGQRHDGDALAAIDRLPDGATCVQRLVVRVWDDDEDVSHATHGRTLVRGPVHCAYLLGLEEASFPLADMRSLDFLDGRRYIVSADTCRGCFMNEREADLPPILEPVYDDGELTVRQDAEWPVPGFMVLGVRKHLATIADLPLSLAIRVVTVMRAVRGVMRDELGLVAVQVYQEDKFVRPHFHFWMLPLWPGVMREHDINPRIYESNITRYLEIFRFAAAEDEIQRCAGIIRRCLPYRLAEEARIPPR